MKENLEQKLARDFPFMRQRYDDADKYTDVMSNNLYNTFGIESDDGWFDLIYNCCREIQEAYNKRGIKPDFYPLQIKEKYGTLRVYYGGSLDEREAADDKSAEYEEAWKDVKNIVEKYENISETICEHCGSPGTLRTNRWYLRTLCDDCYEAFWKD